MSLSEYFEDEDVVNQLRSFYDEEEQWVIDFNACLSNVEEDLEDEDYLRLKIKNRVFRIHTVLGFVEEVE